MYMYVYMFFKRAHILQMRGLSPERHLNIKFKVRIGNFDSSLSELSVSGIEP